MDKKICVARLQIEAKNWITDCKKFHHPRDIHMANNTRLTAVDKETSKKYQKRAKPIYKKEMQVVNKYMKRCSIPVMVCVKVIKQGGGWTEVSVMPQ